MNENIRHKPVGPGGEGILILDVWKYL